MKKFSIVAFAVLTAWLISSPVAAAPVKAGTGKAEIVVPPGMPLSGYGQRINQPNTGTHDPVFMRALVIESGGKRLGLVNGDFLMMTLELHQDLEARVADLNLDLLVITATHTHYSIGAYIDNPVAEIAVMGKYDPRAYDIVVETMEAALRQAAQTLVPASIGAASVDAPGVASNRRHEGGPTDPTFRVLAVSDQNGKIIAILMNHAIHPTTMPGESTLVSGDNAGFAEAWLEARHPGAIAMFLNAGEGDQSPKAWWKDATWEAVEQLGTKMGESAEAALAKIQPDPDVELGLYRRTFKMPRPKMRWSLECWGGLNQLFPIVGKDMLREEGLVMAVSIDDALLLFSPGELAVGVQFMLEASFPDRQVFVVSHSNDYYGYVLTAEDYATGGYETCMNFFGPHFADLLVQEFNAMVLAQWTASGRAGR